MSIVHEGRAFFCKGGKRKGAAIRGEIDETDGASLPNDHPVNPDSQSTITHVARFWDAVRVGSPKWHLGTKRHL